MPAWACLSRMRAAAPLANIVSPSRLRRKVPAVCSLADVEHRPTPEQPVGDARRRSTPSRSKASCRCKSRVPARGDVSGTACPATGAGAGGPADRSRCSRRGWLRQVAVVARFEVLRLRPRSDSAGRGMLAAAPRGLRVTTAPLVCGEPVACAERGCAAKRRPAVPPLTPAATAGTVTCCASSSCFACNSWSFNTNWRL